MAGGTVNVDRNYGTGALEVAKCNCHNQITDRERRRFAPSAARTAAVLPLV
jgi:hypothetical protein